MAKTKQDASDDPPELHLKEGDDLNGSLKHLGGSASDSWNNMLANQVINTLWLGNDDEAARNKKFTASLSALIGAKPGSELEAMAAAQLLAAHNAAMECFRRAMIPDQHFESRRENLNQANKLSRTWVTLLEALNKHRGKGEQKVTVEHVHVHDGGQAIVGNVGGSEGGGVESESEERPHAKQIGHASEPPLWGEDAAGNGLPIPRDGERAVPDARRKGARRSGGE